MVCGSSMRKRSGAAGIITDISLIIRLRLSMRGFRRNCLLRLHSCKTHIRVKRNQRHLCSLSFFQANGNDDLLVKYEMQPFVLKVQSLARTLVDKVFALCDYMLDGRTERQSRHIYDISRLLTAVQQDDELKTLVRKVRSERKGGIKNLSTEDGVNIPSLLVQIREKGFFKSDYEQNTMLLLKTPMPYDEAIKSLDRIIKSDVFL